jgi:hypothetical protein
MAKIKLAKGKPKRSRLRPEGVSCLVLIVSGLVLSLLFVYFVLKNANG